MTVNFFVWLPDSRYLGHPCLLVVVVSRALEVGQDAARVGMSRGAPAREHTRLLVQIGHKTHENQGHRSKKESR